ncbi:MAG TPA: hypothetical protein VFO35_14175, partial [Steroidobacteraceae bacterium]|nr:hypothetical protein [Steroidobacteraceae bacterium]
KRARLAANIVNRTLASALSDLFGFGSSGSSMARAGLIPADAAPRRSQGYPSLLPPALQSLKPEGAQK